jgi:hypothetical protein
MLTFSSALLSDAAAAIVNSVGNALGDDGCDRDGAAALPRGAVGAPVWEHAPTKRTPARAKTTARSLMTDAPWSTLP